LITQGNVQHRRLGGLRLAAAFTVLALLIACAGAPVQEMSDARQAVAAAEQSLAGKPVSPDLAKARQYLQSAQAALDAGDFGAAREDAEVARQLALRAMGLSQPGDASGHPGG